MFDNFDNINVKIAMTQKVDVVDLNFARLLLNFIAACAIIKYNRKDVVKDVPDNFKLTLGYRSVMILVDQVL